ncbi:PhzF family phenazine biosynthesis protein [Novosphingobium soli]|uniref:PhzF family phenazine biosynthesis protein n=1 Tax=Novosphingobium soli TaxID=574956 RepID=A0ABV6CYA5_9SPHN
MMKVERIAAFCNGDHGGNPAGVVLCDALPAAADMQAVAAEVGYSETAFAERQGDAWRVRYFAPTMEVPFCGHATIALGAALSRAHGDGRFDLRLNDGIISVEGKAEGGRLFAALQSPPTRSAAAQVALVDAALTLFGLSHADLDDRLPPGLIEAGARHLLLAVGDRSSLAGMDYDLDAGADLMRRWELTTIALVHAETPQRFHTRNAFAIGAVREDPATGAAAAAFAGYLRDRGWPHGGRIEILQGDDMGIPCRLFAEIGAAAGSSIRVSGVARIMLEDADAAVGKAVAE